MSSDAAGYDLYSAEEITIALNKIGKVQTDIAIHPPQGT
jgi:dUTPase